jgi:RNA polymerase sigma-54 factor
MTKLDLGLSPQLGLAFRATTETVLTAELLSMSAPDLAERLLAEAARNPALVVEVRDPQIATGSVLPRPGRRPLARAVSVSDGACEHPAHEHPALRLVADAATALTAEDRPLALEIAFGLDDRGFLTATPEELAHTLRVTRARVCRIIDALRASGPEGIATSGPRECVIAQLRAIEQAPAWRDLAILLLERALPDLARGRLDPAARGLGVSRTQVEEALAGMRRHARPYPDWDPPGCVAGAARADVIVDLLGDRVIVRLAEDEGLIVRVDERLRGDDPRLARAAREAEAWARRVDCRRSAMLAVAQAAVAMQEPALRHGLAHLRPLTRREVARATGLPESTVSRVVSERVLRTPCGRLLPFAALFGAALDALSVLGRLISQASVPKSDRALAEAMAEAGHPIARRTVAKYRARLGISPLAEHA